MTFAEQRVRNACKTDLDQSPLLRFQSALRTVRTTNVLFSSHHIAILGVDCAALIDFSFEALDSSIPIGNNWLTLTQYAILSRGF